MEGCLLATTQHGWRASSTVEGVTRYVCSQGRVEGVTRVMTGRLPSGDGGNGPRHGGWPSGATTVTNFLLWQAGGGGSGSRGYYLRHGRGGCGRGEKRKVLWR